MLVHSRNVNLTFNQVEMLPRKELPEVPSCRRKAFASPEFSEVVITEDLGESFVEGDVDAVCV